MSAPRNKGIGIGKYAHNAQVRTGRKKANITEQRLVYRNALWSELRRLLRRYLHAAPSNQRKMARALGLQDSQLHRYSCPVCEHEQEPSFSLGIAMLLYLQQNLLTQTNKPKPTIDI
jgi:hypothetical protein